MDARTRGVALGDIDGDGDLDVVFANNTGNNTGYLNDAGVLQSGPGWFLTGDTNTQQVSLGDIDGDGDLDLVCANSGEKSRLYLNVGGTLQTSPAWESSQADPTTSVVLGDVDGDGDLDLVCGNTDRAQRSIVTTAERYRRPPSGRPGRPTRRRVSRWATSTETELSTSSAGTCSEAPSSIPT